MGFFSSGIAYGRWFDCLFDFLLCFWFEDKELVMVSSTFVPTNTASASILLLIQVFSLEDGKCKR